MEGWKFTQHIAVIAETGRIPVAGCSVRFHVLEGRDNAVEPGY